MLQILFWLNAAVLVYVYVGYPLLMVAASLASRRTVDPSSWEPQVSMLIPAHNEAAVIADKLANALALDYPREKLEILVGDDCSTDNTVEVAKKFEQAGLQVMQFAQRRGKASVVNDLARIAGGEVLLLCDANVMFAPDALRHLLAALVGNRVGAATGDVRLQNEKCSFGSGERLYYWLERRIQVGESAIGSLMGVDGGMYVLRKELYRELAPDTILDDFVISMQVIRQGWRVVYQPDAVADESATPSARSEFRRRVRIAAGAVQSVRRLHFPPLARPVELWQYLSHKFLRWGVPLLLLGLLAMSAALWPEQKFFQLLTVAQLAGYTLAGLCVLSGRMQKTAVGGAVFYFAMTFLAMLVGMVKGLFVRPSGTWTTTDRQAATPS